MELPEVVGVLVVVGVLEVLGVPMVVGVLVVELDAWGVVVDERAGAGVPLVAPEPCLAAEVGV